MAPQNKTTKPHFDAHELLIRPATVEDAHAIALIHVASWRETYTEILPQAMLDKLSFKKRETFWHRVLSSQPTTDSQPTPSTEMPLLLTGMHVFVAEFIREAHRLIVGFACCSPQRDQTLLESGYEGEFQAIYILRAYQKLGFGRGLMARMAESLHAQGTRRAALWVLDSNRKARDFYESLGGENVLKKEDQRGDITLIDCAYGWQDITTLM
ncbi:hypothetical protein LMG33818_001288 [Halomonadaceae bacterium LMG 33818]|uniref:GNAT family N-acetyltransferase n=1 Tax=Cernens ardua TaxID=3402176 RepID=UPI003EDC4CFB